MRRKTNEKIIILNNSLLILFSSYCLFKSDYRKYDWSDYSKWRSVSCQTESYGFCFTGQYPADTEKACINSGAGTLDDSNNTVDVSDGTTIEFDAANENVTWAYAVDDEIGTLFFSFKVEDGDSNEDIDTNCLIEIYEDAQNRIILSIADATDKLTLNHEGQDDNNDAYSANALSLSTKYRVGITWEVGEDGNDLAVSCVEKGSATSWNEYDRDLTAFDAGQQPSSFSIGEDDSNYNVTDDIVFYPSEGIVYIASFKATDPNP